MADGSVSIAITADDAEAQAKLEELRKEIQKTEKALESTTGKRDGISEALQNARDEAEVTAQKIQDIKAEMSDYNEVLAGKMRGDISVEDFVARRDRQAELTAQLQEQEKIYAKQNAHVQGLEQKEASLTQQIQAQTAQLTTQKNEAGEIESVVARQSGSAMPQIREAVEGVNTSLRKGFKNILKWGFGIRSTFILIRRLRSALKEGISSFAEQDPETKKNLDDLKASLATLKGSWGAAFAPIVNAVIPLLQKLIGWLTTAAEYVGMFLNALSGKSTYKRAIANNNALAKSYGGAGKAAKDAKKQLMGFDEINKLNAEEDSGGGGGGGSSPLTQYEDVEIPDKFQKVIEFIKENIYELETIVGTALLAIGAILLFTWANPLLGLSMIIAGLAMVGNVVMNWSKLSEEMQRSISLFLGIIGGALLVVGAILAFSGANIPMGIGLIAAGAVALGTAVGLNWDAVRGFMDESIGGIMLALGSALLVLGAVLTFSGVNIPLGLGLMVAGGAALGIGAKHYDWTALLGQLKDTWSRIKDWWNTNVAKYFTLTYWQEKFTAAFGNIHIPLPHLTVQWEPVTADNPIAKLLGIGALPHFGVQWYAKGGIVDGATLIGAGEAGKEAIVPLERNKEWISTVANGIVDRLTENNRLGDYISGKLLPSVMSGQTVPPRALSGGGSVFTDGDIQRLVNGLSEVLGDMFGDNVTKVYLDSREIAQAVTRRQREMERGYA